MRHSQPMQPHVIRFIHVVTKMVTVTRSVTDIILSCKMMRANPFRAIWQIGNVIPIQISSRVIKSPKVLSFPWNETLVWSLGHWRILRSDSRRRLNRLWSTQLQCCTPAICNSPDAATFTTTVGSIYLQLLSWTTFANHFRSKMLSRCRYHDIFILKNQLKERFTYFFLNFLDCNKTKTLNREIIKARI